MALSDLISSDVARLISTDDFATTITYRDMDDLETSLTAIVFAERTENRDTRGLNTIYRVREVTFSRGDLATVNLRSVVIIDDVEWAIASISYQDDYITTLQLEKHQLHEHTRPDYRNR